jgi:hypothetical protein
MEKEYIDKIEKEYYDKYELFIGTSIYGDKTQYTDDENINIMTKSLIFWELEIKNIIQDANIVFFDKWSSSLENVDFDKLDKETSQKIKFLYENVSGFHDAIHNNLKNSISQKIMNNYYYIKNNNYQIIN